MSTDSLIVKYRPAKFSEVVGQKDVVASFRAALEDGTSHAFLFAGPAGVGKTTLARLGAKFLGTSRANLIEVDAATYSGVDDMRALTAPLAYRALGKDNTKSLIVDEAQAISRAGWQSLLKMVEEPPSWVTWFFCTTDPAKVPESIMSRCSVYNLKPLRPTELVDYLNDIVQAEGFNTDRQIVDLCAKKAEGSPRRALSYLAVCYAAEDRAEAASLISVAEAKQDGLPYALARAIADGWSWSKVQPILQAMREGDENPETVRKTVQAYFTTAVLGAKDEKAACRAFAVLDHFSEPFNSADGVTPVVTAVGRVLFS